MVSQPINDIEARTEKNCKTWRPLVSLVVPAYNEAPILEESLIKICDHMKTLEHDYRWELIIVNDGSTDETGDIADDFASTKDNVKVLHHMYNFRLGQALRYAFSSCRGDYIVTLDVDLSYSPDHVKKLLLKIRTTRAKVVIASPYMKGGKVSNVPWMRRTMSKWANRFLSFTVTSDIFSDKLSTITGMVRAYDGKFLRRLNLKAMDMDIHPEIIYKSMILRARIVEIPAHLQWKTQKDSGLKRRSSMRILKGIVSYLLSGFMFRPFMFFIIPGLLLMLLAFYPISWAFIHTFAYYGKETALDGSMTPTFSAAVAAAFKLSPHSFIIGGLSLMIAIQLISLGFLALQSKKYYEELFHIISSIYGNSQEEKVN